MGHEQSDRQGRRGGGKRVEGVLGVRGIGFGTGGVGVPVLSSRELGGVLKLILELGTLGLDLEGLNWALIEELDAVAKAAEMNLQKPAMATLGDELAFLDDLESDFDYGVADWVLHTRTHSQHTSTFSRSNFDFEDEGWETCEDEPSHKPPHNADTQHMDLQRIYETQTNKNQEVMDMETKKQNDAKMKMKMRMVEAIKHMPMLNPEMRLVLTGVGRRAAEEGWNEAVMCGLLVLCFLRLFLLDGIA